MVLFENSSEVAPHGGVLQLSGEDAMSDSHCQKNIPGSRFIIALVL